LVLEQLGHHVNYSLNGYQPSSTNTVFGVLDSDTAIEPEFPSSMRLYPD
jgi:hypothetical protein